MSGELIERLRAKWQAAPVLGGGSLNGPCYIRDDGMRLRNPDGPAAAHEIERLRAELSALREADAAVIARLVGAYEAAVAFIESHAADPDLTDEMVRTYAEYQRTRHAFTAAQRQSVSPRPRRKASPSEVKTGRQGIGE